MTPIGSAVPRDSQAPITPRWAEMLRRLRTRSPSSWRHGDREHAARAAVQRLADLAADAATEQRRTVADAGVMALPDQLAVLMADAQAGGVSATTLQRIVDDLAAGLSIR